MPELPLISFSGIVLFMGYNKQEDEYRAIIIAASKGDKILKEHIIVIDFKSDKKELLDKLKLGNIVNGNFYYENLWEDSFYTSDIKDLEVIDCDCSLNNKIKFPSRAWKLYSQGLKSLRGDIGDFFDWERLPPSFDFTNLNLLISEKLKEKNSSLITISFVGMVIRKLGKKHGRKIDNIRKYLCLIPVPETKHVQLPILATCYLPNEATNPESEKSFGEILSQGHIFKCFDVPLFKSVDDNNGYVLIECGKASSRIKLANDKINYCLPAFYNALEDGLYGRYLFWPQIFFKFHPKDSWPHVYKKTKEHMDKEGILANNPFPGWWGGSWYFFKNLPSDKTGIDGVILLINPFRKNSKKTNFLIPVKKWKNIYTIFQMEDYYFPKLPGEVIILPENKQRKDLKEFGCAVSISEKPEVIKGNWRPDAETLNLVFEWIRKNLEALNNTCWDKEKFKSVDANAEDNSLIRYNIYISNLNLHTERKKLMSYNPWDDFILYTIDSDAAWPLRNILKNGFYYVYTSNEKGEAVYALYDWLQFSKPDMDYLQVLAKAICYITDKPVYIHVSGHNYKILHDEISQIDVIPEPIPDPTSTEIMPGPTRCKWGSSCAGLRSKVMLNKEKSLFLEMKKNLLKAKKDSELEKATLRVLERFYADTNRAKLGSPSWHVIEFFRENENGICLWAYDASLASEKNYSQTEELVTIISDFGYKGFYINDKNKPGYSFIFATPGSKHAKISKELLTSLAYACGHPFGLYRSSASHFFKISVSDPEKEITVSESLPIDEKQLNEILHEAYGEGCLLPEAQVLKEFTIMKSLDAIKKNALLLKALKKSGFRAIAEKLGKNIE